MLTVQELEIRLRESNMPEQRITVLNDLAWELRRQDPTRAFELSEEACTLADSLNDRAGMAQALATKATVLHRRGEIEAAVTCCQQAIRIAESIGEKVAYGRARWTLGWIAIHQGEMADALDHFVAMHDAAKAAGHLANEGSALNSIGVVYGIKQDYPNALKAFEASLAIAEGLGDQHTACGLLNNLAALRGEQHDHEGTLTMATRARDLSRSLDYTYGEYTALINIGTAYGRMQQHLQAAQAFQEALSLVERSDFGSDTKTILVELGKSYIGLDRHDEAVETLNRALELAKESGEKPIELTIYTAMVDLYRRQGNYERALWFTEQAYTLEREMNSEENALRYKELEVQYRTRQAEAEARYHQSLRDQERQHYQALMKMKDDLIAMTSHDIKSPLTVILTNVFMLSRVLPPDDQMQRRLNAIERQTLFISRMITDMLDLAYLESGQPIEKTYAPLSAFIREIVENLRESCEQAGLSLTFVPLGQDVALPYHKGHFERMLNNLISNAIKHTPVGGRIDVELEQHGDAVEIVIRDTGCGIAESDRAHIFERFFRSHADRETQDGHSGLGLTIVKTIVEHHSGSIRVESELNEGTTFYLRFPLTVKMHLSNASA